MIFELKCSDVTIHAHHVCVDICLSRENNLQWLQDAFLGYFSNWEAGVQDRPGFTTAQKALMLLSKETREGLQMTGTYICSLCVSSHNFIHACRYILIHHYNLYTHCS